MYSTLWPTSQNQRKEQDFYEVPIFLRHEVIQGCFYVFYDKNQLVQQRQSLDWVKTVECRLVLTANCRNTKNIAITSNKSLGIEKVKMRLEVAGSKPDLYVNETRELRTGYSVYPLTDAFRHHHIRCRQRHWLYLLRLCGPPSIPLSFTVAGVLPRWDA